MWASGDYPSMVETFLLPLGPRLVEACGIGPGMTRARRRRRHRQRVDPRRAARRDVTASDLTPELLEAGRHRAEGAGVELGWVEADAENLPFDDASFDCVISSIGVMFAPHHQAAADELVRCAGPGGTIGLLSWTPEGMIGSLFRTIGPSLRRPRPARPSPPLWGSEDHLRELFGDHVDLHTSERGNLEVTAFPRPRLRRALQGALRPDDRGPHNAEKNGRAEEFDAALDAFCEEWNRGTADPARFEIEYLVAVGTRAPRPSRREARREAAAAASRRDVTPSFCNTAETWWSTVFGAITSAAAISAFAAGATNAEDGQGAGDRPEDGRPPRLRPCCRSSAYGAGARRPRPPRA